MRFTAAVRHEGDWHVARCLEVEVKSQGPTVEEALASLREALELCFEDEAPPEGLEASIIATFETLCMSPAVPVVSGTEVVAALTKGTFWPRQPTREPRQDAEGRARRHRAHAS